MQSRTVALLYPVPDGSLLYRKQIVSCFTVHYALWPYSCMWEDVSQLTLPKKKKAKRYSEGEREIERGRER